jgi:phosphoribosylformylglycinamidine cyclo-ligase
MCVNDIVVQGAEPLFFLDYLATGKLSLEVSTQIIEGIARGCLEAGCALIGGETAEMPSFYRRGEYDLAGFAVGVVERERVIDGSSISVGDQLIGLGSSGLHSNGYSLARKVLFNRMGLKVTDRAEGLPRTVGEELLVPTRIYVKPILSLLGDFHIHGIAHITGGGFTENIPRIIPSGCRAVVRRKTWPIPPIFKVIQDGGNISEGEMDRTFNNGIGMILAVPPQEAKDILLRLEGLKEKAYLVGEIIGAKAQEHTIQFE